MRASAFTTRAAPDASWQRASARLCPDFDSDQPRGRLEATACGRVGRRERPAGPAGPHPSLPSGDKRSLELRGGDVRVSEVAGTHGGRRP